MKGWRAALLLAGIASPAWAGPPYVTDDPVPTDRGHWEIYQFVAGARAAGIGSGEAGVDLNYGAAEGLQLTLVLPAAYERAADSRIGAGTVEAAAKWRFVHGGEDEATPDIAFFPRAFLPTATADLGSSRAQLLLPLWIGKDLGAWSIFGGGGYQFNPGPGARDFWTGGVALTRQLSRRLALGTELYARTADAPGGRSLVAANLGMTLAFTPHWSLLASLGPGLAHASAEGEYAFYLALKADY